MNIFHKFSWSLFVSLLFSSGHACFHFMEKSETFPKNVVFWNEKTVNYDRVLQIALVRIRLISDFSWVSFVFSCKSVSWTAQSADTHTAGIFPSALIPKRESNVRWITALTHWFRRKLILQEISVSAASVLPSFLQATGSGSPSVSKTLPSHPTANRKCPHTPEGGWHIHSVRSFHSNPRERKMWLLESQECLISLEEQTRSDTNRWYLNPSRQLRPHRLIWETPEGERSLNVLKKRSKFSGFSNVLTETSITQ